MQNNIRNEIKKMLIVVCNSITLNEQHHRLCESEKDWQGESFYSGVLTTLNEVKEKLEQIIGEQTNDDTTK